MRRGAVVLLLFLLLAGCGGEDPVSSGAVRRAVEQASGLTLKALDPPEPEVRTMFAATGKGQFVQVYVLANDADARTLGERAPATSVVKTLAHRNLFVVASGSKAAAVIRAIEKF